MKVELRPIGDIKPYENNPRNNDDAVDAVVESIRRFGFRQPIVVDGDGVIVVGHTRLKAAQRLGLAKVPVHVARDLTPDQARAYRIADNQVATLATFNFEMLSIEMAALKGSDFDWSALGFDQEELGRLLDGGVRDGLTDPDSIPAQPDAAITKRGDIWQLGEHRLMCGDSALAADVDRLLDGERVQLVNTDPPYNVKVEPRSNNAIAAGLSSFAPSKPTHHQSFDKARRPGISKATHAKLRPKDRPLENDFVSDEKFDELLDAWFGNMSRVLEPGGGFYIWGGYANLGNYPPFLKKHGLYFSQAIVWDKMHPVLTRKDYLGAFEIAFYGWREGAAHRWYGPTNDTDLWHVKKVPPQHMQHLTEKSVELAVRAIRNSSKEGDVVLDLFGGSGSTLIACEQTSRRSRLMEIDPLYADVIVQRFEQFAGRKAQRLNASGIAPKRAATTSRAERKAPAKAEA